MSSGVDLVARRRRVDGEAACGAEEQEQYGTHASRQPATYDILRRAVMLCESTAYGSAHPVRVLLQPLCPAVLSVAAVDERVASGACAHRTIGGALRLSRCNSAKHKLSLVSL